MSGGDVIGIDLGTTFSCVAVARNGSRTTPSFVAFSASDSQLLIGEAAKNQAVLNSRRTVFDVKRLIGKKSIDREVQNNLKYLPYSVVDRGGKPNIELEVQPGITKAFSPEEISAIVLGKINETAEYLTRAKFEDIDWSEIRRYKFSSFQEDIRRGREDARRCKGR
ncbi:Heat shock 70 kDa protein BIP2 [Linum grandiflorum]